MARLFVKDELERMRKETVVF